MKKILTLLAVLFVFLKVSGQSPCTVDSSKFPKGTNFGIYPDSLIAPANYDYSQVMQFKFPKDSTYSGFAVTIDSVKIDSVNKLPKTFSYQCMSKTCTYKGGSFGCAVVKGKPVNSQKGVYKLHLYFTIYVHSALIQTEIPVPDSGALKLTIDSNGHNSSIFDQFVNTKFEVCQNYPNPFNQGTIVSFNSPGVQPVYVIVRNELGQEVYMEKLPAMEGPNTFNFARKNLPQGMYFYSIQNGVNIITKSMVIKD